MAGVRRRVVVPAWARPEPDETDPPPLDDAAKQRILDDLEEPPVPPPQTADERAARHWPTILEVEQQIGVTAATIRRWCASGKVRAVTIDRAYRVCPEDVIAMQRQEDRLRKITGEQGIAAAQAALATLEEAGALAPPGQSPPASLLSPQQQQLQIAMLSAVADLVTTANAGAQQDKQFSKELIQYFLTSAPRQAAGFQMQIDSLIAMNSRLNEENAKLREELRAYHESIRQDRLKEKELEIKASNARQAWETGKSLAPQVLAMIGSHLSPHDPGPSDGAVAAVLKEISQEQAIRLASENLVTDQQAIEAVGFRNGTPAPGALTAWIRSFSGDQVARILASDVLSRDQKVAFAAAHEVAQKYKGPVASVPTAPASAPAGKARVSGENRILTGQEVRVIRAWIGALLECSDVEVTTAEGAKRWILEIVGEKMTAEERAGIKSIRWDRVQEE